MDPDRHLQPTQTAIPIKLWKSVSVLIYFCVCTVHVCVSVFVPPLQSWSYFNHDVCPLSCSFSVGPCGVLCVLCNTWRPQPECKCAYVRYSIDHRSLKGWRWQRKLLNISYIAVHAPLPLLNSSIQLTFVSSRLSASTAPPCSLPIVAQCPMSVYLPVCLHVFVYTLPQTRIGFKIQIIRSNDVFGS